MKALFKALQANPGQFANAAKGEEFEDRIQVFLRKNLGYTRIRDTDQVSDYSRLKELSLQETKSDPIPNTYGIGDAFIYQPNGSQNYPDFLVFESKEVVCVETKFAKPARPVWNSGLPRPNGFYIIGRKPPQVDVTFFRGRDVVSAEESRKMHDFFARLKREEDKFNRSQLAGQRRGFAVYNRKAFQQGKQYNPNADIDFYNSSDRAALEKNVIAYFK